MAAQILNFKKVEVNGYTKPEALEKAPFTVFRDATQAYKTWKKEQTSGITDKEIKQFCLDYLAKHTKNAPGIGCSITMESAVADTRERPYKVDDVKNEKGKRKYVTTYQLIDDKTGEVIAETNKTKAEAKEIGKQLYKDGYKGNLTCSYTKQVLEGEPIAFYMTYTPAKNSKPGTYLCFGIEA